MCYSQTISFKAPDPGPFYVYFLDVAVMIMAIWFSNEHLSILFWFECK